MEKKKEILTNLSVISYFISILYQILINNQKELICIHAYANEVEMSVSKQERNLIQFFSEQKQPAYLI